MENIASNLFYSPLSYCFCRELNDGLASDGIDGDVPELLKAILSRDPTLFQSKKPAGWYNTMFNFCVSIHYLLSRGWDHPQISLAKQHRKHYAHVFNVSIYMYIYIYI